MIETELKLYDNIVLNEEDNGGEAVLFSGSAEYDSHGDYFLNYSITLCSYGRMAELSLGDAFNSDNLKKLVALVEKFEKEAKNKSERIKKPNVSTEARNMASR